MRHIKTVIRKLHHTKENENLACIEHAAKETDFKVASQANVTETKVLEAFGKVKNMLNGQGSLLKSLAAKQEEPIIVKGERQTS